MFSAVPISYIILQDRRVISVLYRGVIGEENIRRFKLQVENEPAFQSGFSILFDFTGITRLNVTAVYARELAERLCTHKNRLVFAAPQPDVFGMARMYQTVAN